MDTSHRLLWPAVIIGLAAGVVAGVLGAAVFYAGSAPQAGDAAGPPPSGGPPPASVRVGVVEMQTLQHRVPLIGRLREVRRVTVTAEVEGKVIDMAVDEGDLVEGGATTIAQIDKVWAELRFQAAAADTAAAEAQAKQSQNDLKQLERLEQAGSAKAKEVQDARTLVAGDQARLAAAVAARQQASTEVLRTTIAAPFDGAVSRKLVEVGQWVEPGDGVIEMISVGQIDAVIDVPEHFVNAISVGDKVEVVVDVLDGPVLGKIVSVRPDGTNASRTFPVKIRLPDLGGKLRAGMSVTANLPISREGQFITVPRDAVLLRPAGAVVWYAQAMGGPLPAAFPEPVTVLFGVGGRYAVEPLPGGAFPALTAGTQVVIEGAERLFPTQPLNITPAPGTPPAPAPGTFPGNTSKNTSRTHTPPTNTPPASTGPEDASPSNTSPDTGMPNTDGPTNTNTNTDTHGPAQPHDEAGR